jgi:hypothetical protein
MGIFDILCAEGPPVPNQEQQRIAQKRRREELAYSRINYEITYKDILIATLKHCLVKSGIGSYANKTLNDRITFYKIFNAFPPNKLYKDVINEIDFY